MKFTLRIAILSLTLSILLGTVGIMPTSAPALMLASTATWITSVVWNPDTTRIATTSEDKVLRVWDARTGRVLFTVDDVSSAIWSPDGTRLAVHGELPATRIVSAESGEVLGMIDTLSPSVDWSPDSTRIADVSSGVLTIWGQE